MVRLFYDCGLTIPEISLTFDGATEISIRNHRFVDAEISPGKHKVHAEYTLIADNERTQFVSDRNVDIEDGCSYRVTIDRIMKSFSLEKC